EVAPILIVLLMMLVFLFLGAFMDWIGIALLCMPIFVPIVKQLGYDPIWFGIIVVKMAEVCLVTPPIGLNCFVVSAVRPDIPVSSVFRGVGPFVVADFLTVAVFLIWPEVITWLPNTLMN
ncbi:MAG: TRAP transporter large permease subunit, partial [Oceanibaculum sp.]